MENFLKILKIFIWWILFDIAAAAGTIKSPFFLIVAMIGATYWYWRYPVFKNDKNSNGRDE
jgi:hypothetical protein